MASHRKPAEEENAAPAEETAGVAAAQEPSAADPRDARLRALEEELAAAREQRLRALAEVDNIRKRAERDQTEMSKYAVTAFARDLVQVLENLMRASENIPEEARNDNELLGTLGEGVDLTLQELLAIFEKYGIRRVDPINTKFDPNFHQAVAQVERGDVPPGTVVQVIQAGYVIHDRLLRPAMVAVSKAAGEAAKQVDTTA